MVCLREEVGNSSRLYSNLERCILLIHYVIRGDWNRMEPILFYEDFDKNRRGRSGNQFYEDFERNHSECSASNGLQKIDARAATIFFHNPHEINDRYARYAFCPKSSVTS